MSFIWPEALWLLILVPILTALYVWVLRRRKRAVVRYANLALVKAAMGHSAGWRRHVPPALMLIAIAVLIVAVARPQAVVTLASSRATVILAMDVSGSMQATDVLPSRIEASQAAAKKFIEDQPSNVNIGIVAFASIALLVQSPTTDHDALRAAIDNFELRRGTAVGSGLLTSLRTIFPDTNFYYGIAGGTGDPLTPGLSGRTLGAVDSRTQLGGGQLDPNRPQHVPVAPGSYENAVIILLTDGATTAGPDPIAAGQIAADWGVRVFTVGFGTPGGSVVDFAGRSMRAQLDEPTLQAIAQKTDGQYFAAKSADDLTRVYNSLATKLVGEKKLTEIAFIFAGIGALFAIAAGALSLLWFGRLT
ncbi:MAG TPA: VWA domain-containing protein [Devosia sp.]|jgi:Ca-activated chloride channel family protein|nr:VWA domain-containing protein [Devosia sp.]